MTPEWRAAVAAGLLAAAAAAPSLGNAFAGDDRWVVIDRALLRDPPSALAVLAQPYWPPGFGGVMWRPAVLATFALDYRLGASPRWFHVTNLLWTAAAATVLAALAALVAGPAAGFAAGLLFAAHPVHVEATASIVGRAELMAATGVAAALVCAIKVEERRRYLWGVAAGALLGIASKEHAATLPGAVLLLAAGRAQAAGADWRAALRRALPAAAVAAAPISGYFVLRPLVVPGTLAAGGLAPGLGGLSLLERVWAMLPISLEWWRLMLFPAHLSADYSPAQVVVTTGLTPRHLLAAAVWGGAGWLAWRLRRRAPAVPLGLAWFALTVLPVSNVLLPTEVLVAERTLFLPSWGATLAFGGLWGAWSGRAAVRAGALALAVIAGAGRSMLRASVWRDDERLFQSLLRDAPRSYRTLWTQGRDEFAAGRMANGERLLRAAIAAAPALPGPRDDLARAYAAAGLWRPAIALLRESIAADGTRPPPWQLLPAVLLAAGDTVGAAAAAREAIRRFPDDPEVRRTAERALTAAQSAR